MNCDQCGALIIDERRACGNCARLAGIAIALVPTMPFTSKDILNALQKIQKMGASLDAAQQTIRTAANLNMNCVQLADEIVAGWHRKQRRRGQ